MRWERRVNHPGLKAFRVIRGSDPQEVNTKAELQVKKWDEKWQKLQAAMAAASDKAQKKQIAEAKTREAEEQLAAISNTLLGSLSKDHRVNWDDLKDKTPFSITAPQKPSPSGLPRRPLREDAAFRPNLGLLDKLVRARRERKIAECQRRFQASEEQWKNEVAARQIRDETRNKEFLVTLKGWENSRIEFDQKQSSANAQIDKKRTNYEAKTASGVVQYCNMILERSEYPDNFPRSCLLEYLEETKTLVAEYDLPPVTALPTVKEVKYLAAKDAFTETHVTESSLNRTYDDLIYKIALRTVNELFRADAAEAVDVIVFNGWVSSIDKATGNTVNACILSVQVLKVEFDQINLALADPRACFKKLKGISASTLVQMTPVRPILQIKREDKRFVDAYAVADSLDASSNLAAMDWEDFENLIREVFEKIFSKDGGEVKITRASRDGGVDAVAFDPDPIRGGKTVIQAKRYTNTVSVSAVRDLYGTLINEGTNSGILVTTADYGPDSYEFVKDKPLKLINGNELLYLLAEHGHRAKIDLVEARKLLGEKER